MSPTECFKNHDIPFRRKEKKQRKTKQNKNPQRREKENRLMWSSPSTFPGASTSSWPTLEHLGWGHSHQCLLESLFHGNEDPLGGRPLACMGWRSGCPGPKRPHQLPAPGNSGRANPAPGPWHQSQDQEALSQALGYQSNQVDVV